MHNQETNTGSVPIEPALPHDRGSGRGRRRHDARDARQLRRMFWLASQRVHPDDGAATAEYAVATMAAVGFAGLLIIILRGDEVRAILTDLVRNALTVG